MRVLPGRRRRQGRTRPALHPRDPLRPAAAAAARRAYGARVGRQRRQLLGHAPRPGSTPRRARAPRTRPGRCARRAASRAQSRSGSATSRRPAPRTSRSASLAGQGASPSETTTTGAAGSSVGAYDAPEPGHGQRGRRPPRGVLLGERDDDRHARPDAEVVQHAAEGGRPPRAAGRASMRAGHRTGSSPRPRDHGGVEEGPADVGRLRTDHASRSRHRPLRHDRPVTRSAAPLLARDRDPRGAGEAVAQAGAAAGSMAGWQVQGPRPAPTSEDALRSLDPRGALFLGGTMSDDARAEQLRERRRAGVPRRCPTCPSTPGARASTPPRSCTPASTRRLRRHPRRPRLRLVAPVAPRPARLKDLLAMALHDARSTTRWSEHLRGRRVVGVMGGHAAQPHRPGVRRRGPPRAPARRRRAHRRHRRRSGRDGGGQPRRPARRRTSRAALEDVLREIAGVPGVPPTTSAPGRGRRSTRSPASATRAARSASRPGTTATSRRTCSLGGGEVLPQRDPRGRAAGGVPRRDRLPARRRRHGAGGLPGGVHATTTPPPTRWRRWSSWARTTGRRRCRPGRCSAPSPTAGPSARSRRPRRRPWPTRAARLLARLSRSLAAPQRPGLELAVALAPTYAAAGAA